MLGLLHDWTQVEYPVPPFFDLKRFQNLTQWLTHLKNSFVRNWQKQNAPSKFPERFLPKWRKPQLNGISLGAIERMKKTDFSKNLLGNGLLWFNLDFWRRISWVQLKPLFCDCYHRATTSSRLIETRFFWPFVINNPFDHCQRLKHGMIHFIKITTFFV